MKWILTLALVVASCLGGASLALAATGEPPGDTIVSVTGDKANGFEIRHFDGSEEFPPPTPRRGPSAVSTTRRLDCFRCRVETQPGTATSATSEQALDWAHAS